jgi:hypothetical protein
MFGYLFTDLSKMIFIYSFRFFSVHDKQFPKVRRTFSFLDVLQAVPCDYGL